MCVSDVDLYHVLLTRQEGYRVVSCALFLSEGSGCGRLPQLRLKVALRIILAGGFVYFPQV